MKIRLLLFSFFVVLLGVATSQVQITTNTADILPSNPEIQETLSAAAEFSGAQTLLVEVDGSGVDRAALHAEVERLAAALRALDTVTAVRMGFGVDDAKQVYERVEPHATTFVPIDVLKERVSRAGMKSILEAQRAKLAGGWAGMFQLGRIKDDPLDLIQAGLDQLSAGAQAGIHPEDGMLLDDSGTHALLFVSTTIQPNRVNPNDPRVEALATLFDHSELPIQWFGGARIAYDTATLIKHDVELSAGLGMVLLGVVLFVGFRSWRPLVGAIGPSVVAASCATLGAWWASPVHGLQLGFSAALAGLAVDYWVHLYLAAAVIPGQTDRSSRYRAALRALEELRPALLVSAGSTALAFGVLTTSELPLVRVLGITGAAAAIGALLGTMVAGPIMWSWLGRPRDPLVAKTPTRWIVTPLVLFCVFLGLTGMSGVFEANPMELVARADGTRLAEQTFSERYSISARRALVLVTGEEPGEVLDRAEKIQGAFDRLGYVKSTGPAGVLPGPAAVKARRELLPSVEALQAQLDEVSAELNLPPFEGAAARIYQRLSDVPVTLWDGSAMADRVALIDNRALVAVPLFHPDIVPALTDTLWAVDSDAHLTIPTDLAAQSMEDARRAILSRAVFGGLAVFVLLSVRHRDPGLAVLSLLPAGGAILASAGAVAWSGSPWNPVSLAAMVPVLGLAVDYGVFMTESYSASASRAVTLSAATTVAGFFTLGLATSPALYGVGVATVAGVGMAGMVAIFVIPALRQGVWPGRRTALALNGVALVATVGFMIDVSLFVIGAFTPPPIEVLPEGTLTQVGNERRFGSGRFARTDGIWVLSTQGGPVEAGYSANQVTQNVRPRLEDELFESFDTQVPNPLFQWIITRGSNLIGMGLDKHISLNQKLEVRAGDLADPDPYWFKGNPYTRKIYYHAIHDLGQALVDSPLLACTGFMAGPEATADGHWIMGRNFDSEVGVTMDRDKVIRVHQPEGGIPFISVAFAGMIGAVSGVNEAGIGIAINAAGSDDLPRPGRPMTMILSHILQTARSIEEVEQILREQRGFVSENVLVVDADHNKAVLFELTPKRLAKIEVKDWLAVSNHFRSPLYRDDKTNAHRMESTTTVQRLARAEELMARYDGSFSMDRGVDLLTDRLGVGDAPLPRAHRYALNADIATHGVVIDVTERTVWISRYPNVAGGFVEFKLADMVRGDLSSRRVRDPEEGVEVAIQLREARLWLRRARRTGPAEADRLTADALRIMVDHPEALYERGRVLLEAGRREEAIPLLRKALASPPEYEYQKKNIEEWLR